MATEDIHYLTYPYAVLAHILYMRSCSEERYGVFMRSLVESALARPRNAAAYENADLVRQAATLCFGLIKNHPWEGGNKRTATLLTRAFLRANGWDVVAPVEERIEMVLAVESDLYGVDEIEYWLRPRVTRRK
ncbi:MAG: type II toxin-antitoxin system death-on-curing family toxin [Blastocatellia bacterium]